MGSCAVVAGLQLVEIFHIGHVSAFPLRSSPFRYRISTTCLPGQTRRHNVCQSMAPRRRRTESPLSSPRALRLFARSLPPWEVFKLQARRGTGCCERAAFSLTGDETVLTSITREGRARTRKGETTEEKKYCNEERDRKIFQGGRRGGEEAGNLRVIS